MPIHITLEQLIDKNACPEQVALFKKLFGTKIKVTKKLAIKHAQYFNWDWAADNLLSALARAEYDKSTAPARAEYYKSIAPVLAEYYKSIAPVLAEYNKSMAPALAEYDKSIAPARAKYSKSTAPARAKYSKSAAISFIELYLKE